MSYECLYTFTYINTYTSYITYARCTRQAGSGAAKKKAIRAQMLALRSSILADYKKNSRMANTALLLGPSGA